jgi:hypothetical protein
MLSTTPPAGPGIIDDVMSLEQTIEATGTRKPQQAHRPAETNSSPVVARVHPVS